MLKSARIPQVHSSNGLGSGQGVLFNVLTELKAKVAGNP